MAKEFQKQLIPIASGYASTGPDMGSDNFQWIKKPKIAVLSEGKISPYAYGEVWHYFEQDLNYSFHQIRVNQLSENVMKKIDVLIMPSGLYPSLSSEPKKEMIMRWLNQGGRIVAIERALSFFEDKKFFGLKRKENKIKRDPTQRYDERKRNNISNAINGGIYKTILDNSHPIGLGYSTEYYTLKRSALAYSLLEKGINISYIPEGATAVAGFVGKNVANAQEKSLIIGSESIGKGSVSYFVDNPIFRSFWENGKLLLFNSVFLNTN